jgi:hypothetical protein
VCRATTLNSALAAQNIDLDAIVSAGIDGSTVKHQVKLGLDKPAIVVEARAHRNNCLAIPRQKALIGVSILADNQAVCPHNWAYA